jgi:predicted permease
MRALRRFLHRLASMVTRRQDEQRLQAEIEEHVELQTAENIRGGLAPAEARRQALLKFGAMEAIREEYRDQSGLPSLETLFQDARHAIRRLRKAPAFTVATVLTLALGIGATTSIFTLADAVLLKSLPVAKPQQLYRVGREAKCCYIGGYSQDAEFSLVSYDLYKFLRDHTQGFSQLAAFPATEPLFGVRRAGAAEEARTYPGEFVSGNYFTTFGVGAYVGRTLLPADDHPGAPPAAVMSYRLWQEKYGNDPSVVGGIFDVDGKPVTVVGIAPPGFFGDSLRPSPPDFFLPLNIEPYAESDSDIDKPDVHWLELIGRMRPGANAASIEAEMRVELKQWLRSHWNDMNPSDRAKFPKQTLYLMPGGAGIGGMRQQYEHWLQILMAVSGLALLIVCANLANLMLVRGLERRRQIAMSVALGARASRVVREPLLESLLLALIGGAAGVGIAFASTRLILHLAFPSFAGFAGVPINASPSPAVLLFALITSVATGLAFGIGPAWMATRVDPIEALRGAGRSLLRTGARAATLTRSALVVLQAGLALVLLSAAGLFIATLQKFETQDFGFEQDRRIVVNISPREAGYRADQLPLLYRRIHESVAGIPGVASAALCLYPPQWGGGWGAAVFVEGHPPPGPGADIFAAWDRVSAQYLDTIGTPILRGRSFTEQDTATSPKVAVVSEAFARKFFPSVDPIGKRFGSTASAAAQQVEIVGVVKNARYLTLHLNEPVEPFFYLPEAQSDYTKGNMGSLFMNDVIMRTRPEAPVSDARLRQAMASVDPNLPIVSIRSLKEQVAGQFTQQRLIARLVSFFGILSLVLASIGLYGVTAYNAGRRSGEIGVRMALGASRANVVTLVLRGAFGLVLLGVLIGVPLTFALGRLLGTQLYGMDPNHPAVTLAAIVTLAASAFIASFIPAVRASLISPIDALRTE